MTSRGEIERLLNQTGRTLEGLPKQYSYYELANAYDRCESMPTHMICHQSDVIELLVGALRDALDKPMQKTMTLEELKMPKWISVKERLPEDCKDVLVWAVYHEEYGRSWALREVDAYCKDVGWENTADPDVREVTHWMPLPKAPEVSENE